MALLSGPDSLLLAFAELVDQLGGHAHGRQGPSQRTRRTAYIAAQTAERLALGTEVRASALRASLIQRLAAATVVHKTFGRDRLAPGALDDAAPVALALAGASGLAGVTSILTACGAHWDGSGRPTLAGAAIPPGAQVVLAGDLADAAIDLARGQDGVADLPLAADLLVSTAGDELAPEVARAAASILTDTTLHRDLLDPAPAIRRIAEKLAPLAVTGPDLLRRLVVCTEARHPYYRRHGIGTARIALAVGRRLRLDASALARLELASLAHDVGELVLAGDVFASSARFAAPPLSVRAHPLASERFCKSVPFLEEVAEAVLLHHEHVDGLGYPRGLAGDAIPIEARIVAIADAIDAFHGERAFRDALPDDEIARELAARRGTVFDSTIVDAALASVDFQP